MWISQSLPLRALRASSGPLLARFVARGELVFWIEIAPL